MKELDAALSGQSGVSRSQRLGDARGLDRAMLFDEITQLFDEIAEKKGDKKGQDPADALFEAAGADEKWESLWSNISPDYIRRTLSLTHHALEYHWPGDEVGMGCAREHAMRKIECDCYEYPDFDPAELEELERLHQSYTWREIAWARESVGYFPPFVRNLSEGLPEPLRDVWRNHMRSLLLKRIEGLLEVTNLKSDEIASAISEEYSDDWYHPPISATEADSLMSNSFEVALKVMKFYDEMAVEDELREKEMKDLFHKYAKNGQEFSQSNDEVEKEQNNFGGELADRESTVKENLESKLLERFKEDLEREVKRRLKRTPEGELAEALKNEVDVKQEIEKEFKRRWEAEKPSAAAPESDKKVLRLQNLIRGISQGIDQQKLSRPEEIRHVSYLLPPWVRSIFYHALALGMLPSDPQATTLTCPGASAEKGGKENEKEKGGRQQGTGSSSRGNRSKEGTGAAGNDDTETSSEGEDVLCQAESDEPSSDEALMETFSSLRFQKFSDKLSDLESKLNKLQKDMERAIRRLEKKNFAAFMAGTDRYNERLSSLKEELREFKENQLGMLYEDGITITTEQRDMLQSCAKVYSEIASRFMKAKEQSRRRKRKEAQAT